jgi:FSR family fosmidomycin resistance protein-like MFS transporter
MDTRPSILQEEFAAPRSARGLRWSLFLLLAAHAAVDAGSGAIPALVQHFRTELALSYTATGVLVTASSLGGGLAQILVGLVADLKPQPWMPSVGTGLAALGLASAGLAQDAVTAGLTFALIALGSAVFHPEAVRTVYLASGERRATAMATFSIGGSVGWALGPAAVALLAGSAGLGGMRWWLLVGLPVAGALAITSRPGVWTIEATLGEERDGDRNDWAAYLNVLAVSLLRGGVHVAVTVFYPGYLIDVFGKSRTEVALLLSLLLGSGIVTSPVLGRMADRLGPKSVLIGTMAALALLVALLPSVPDPLIRPAMALVGATSMGTLPVSLVLGQAYLPRRRALGGGMQVAVSSFASLFATPFGVLADRHGIVVVLYGAALLAASGALLTARLPSATAERRG